MASGDKRPFHDVHYFITDGEARDFLDQLVQDDPPSELRIRLQSEDPRAVLLEYNIDIEGISEPIELPPGKDIQDFINRYLEGEHKSNNVGYAILYFMLGAMPIVVADRDAAP